MNKSINKLIAIWCCFSLLQCTGQVKHKMEYFNIEVYKDWEIDNGYFQSDNDQSFKKSYDRVRISSDNKNIQVERNSIINPYKKIYVYDKKTCVLRVFVMECYQFSIGIQKKYDEKGILLYEIDNDKPYKFSLQQLIKKLKKNMILIWKTEDKMLLQTDGWKAMLKSLIMRFICNQKKILIMKLTA